MTTSPRTRIGMDGVPSPASVSRIGIVVSWLAVLAILLVVGAGFSLAVQGLLVTRSLPGLLVAGAFAAWLLAVTYRLVRGDPARAIWAADPVRDRPDRSP